ncbi:MAG: HAMP domain-containing histidine kinase [Clostridiales bacterium]|jgi:signal transduction histidine kinase|nr:HAMP domain-containing histidine kinase [Clostridiales bacterium]
MTLMKRLPGVSTFTNSVQLKFAVTFLVLIAGLMVMLNSYPTIVSRDLVFASKQTSLQNQAGVMSSALSTPDELTSDTVLEVMGLLDLRSLTRVVVTDENARILYDTAQLDPGVGRYALFSEISRALKGKIVCYSVYDGKAFMTSEAMPIRNGGLTVGAVYLYEYDAAQAELITNIQTNLRNITLILGIISIILMFIFSRALTLRITELARATKIVSEGNYEYRIKISGSDELSDLGSEFNNLTQRLKDTEELRRRFVSDASHELKTPLASIRLLSDSIVNSENMDIVTMREFVTDIGNEAERLQRTTEKLLSLSKMDSGIGFMREKIDLKHVAEKTLHLLSPLAKENRLTLSAELQRGCCIYGNEDLIYRIIFNLAENGIKYNMPGGQVKILLFREEKSVVLVVEDTGIGIPEEDVPHIFSRFYRVDKARSSDAGGSGLGLSIVYDAVMLHNGSICFEKRENGGSRFIVKFPAYLCSDEEKTV